MDVATLSFILFIQTSPAQLIQPCLLCHNYPGEALSCSTGVIEDLAKTYDLCTIKYDYQVCSEAVEEVMGLSGMVWDWKSPMFHRAGTPFCWRMWNIND